MSYKITEKSNQNELIELILESRLPRTPWLNVQIDQRNPKNLVIKAKTADEASFILLAPFLNSHKEVNAEAVETELSQFIASHNYGVALRDRRVVRLAPGEVALPILLEKKAAPVAVPKHLLAPSQKKPPVPGGRDFKKQIVADREHEDAGLQAFGSEKRAEVLAMLQAKGIGNDVAPAQQKARVVPQLAAKSRLLNQPAPVEEPKAAQPISPKLSRIPHAMPQEALPVIPEETDAEFQLALAMSRSEMAKEPKLPTREVLSIIKEEVDEDLDFAVALSLQQDKPVEVPSIPRFPSPPLAAVPRPYPNPYPAGVPRPSPYNPEFLALQGNHHFDAVDDLSHRIAQSKIDLDAAYAAKLAQEQEEEDRRAIEEHKILMAEQEAEDARMMRLLSESDNRQEKLQREEQDRILAAQIEAKDKQRIKDEQERLSREAIEKIKRQDLIEAKEQQVLVIAKPGNIPSLTQAEIKRQIRCEAYCVNIDLLNQFESLELPALDSDAHDANKGFVRNNRHIVDGLFAANKEIMNFYNFASKDILIGRVLHLLRKQPEYKPNTPYKTAVDTVFGPYVKKDKEEKETGGVSLKDMFVRIYVLLEKNADFSEKDIQDTRAFTFLKNQMNDQSSTCFEGAISRMFCAYWSGVWYFYDITIGLKAKKGFSIDIPRGNI